MSMVHRSLGLGSLLLLGACSRQQPFHVNDVLIHTTDGQVLGTITQLAEHTFPSGITEPSALVRLANGSIDQHWYAVQVLAGNFSVQAAAAPASK